MVSEKALDKNSTFLLGFRLRDNGRNCTIASMYGTGICTVVDLGLANTSQTFKDKVNAVMRIRMDFLSSCGYEFTIKEKFGFIVEVKPVIPASEMEKMSIRERITRSGMRWEADNSGFYVEKSEQNQEFLDKIGAAYAETENFFKVYN